MASDRPKRAYRFTIEVGADTPQEMAWSLQQIASDIKDNINHRSVSGGHSGGWVVTPDHAPGKTHEQYIEELTAYLAERDAAKESPNV